MGPGSWRGGKLVRGQRTAPGTRRRLDPDGWRPPRSISTLDCPLGTSRQLPIAHWHCSGRLNPTGCNLHKATDIERPIGRSQLLSIAYSYVQNILKLHCHFNTYSTLHYFGFYCAHTLTRRSLVFSYELDPGLKLNLASL